ncbi:S49 family peptidase [Lacipirellula limnantheis]|uniref:Signal peptide peptidase SppA n=1 Tax=Lacipirellula limnantheis TaxID=2528024 RepID=A0A517U555_9BACT|nr:S49 family peptidase [Lacipirellula limnantheis]QDT75752.1 Putative signal peptide peptidase SppA [Lacipirellula limnantheis]
MILRRNEPLLFASHLAGSVEEQIAAPRPANTARPSQAAQIGHAELIGFMDPAYNAEVGADLLRLAADDSIDAIVLWVDSGGGYYEGTPELAERLRRATQMKPVHAVIVGYCCSGCLWAITHATSITATPSATIGSIGAYIAVLDASENFKRDGLRVIRIATGALKGHPIDGAEVPDEFVAMLQNRCDIITAKFTIALKAGRKLGEKKVAQLATGEIWFADQAKHLGLIDRVAMPEDALDEIRRGLAPPPAAPRDELHTDLRGYAAEVKMNELAAERFGRECFDDLGPFEAAELQREFPTLAKAYAESLDD